MSVNIVGSCDLRSVLEQQAESIPDETFLLFDDCNGGIERYTYGEFNRSVNRVANGLIKLGVTKGDKVNLHLSNSPELILSWFALAKIGALMVPTHPSSSAEELVYLVDQSESTLVITQPSLVDTVAAIRATRPELRHIVVIGACSDSGGMIGFKNLVANQSEFLPPVPLDPQDDLAIMYTSGTTSRPRGALLTHASYVFKGQLVSKALIMGREDRHLISLPLAHANAQYHFLATLISGASAVVTSRFSASRFLHQALQHGCTMATLFATPIRMLLANQRRPTDGQNNLRLVTFAQVLSELEIDEWHDRFGAPLIQIYGMTETMGMVCANPIDHTKDNSTIGRPLPGYHLEIVDANGIEVSCETPGHLVIRGRPGLEYMKNYYKNPEETARVIKNGKLWTNDIVAMTSNGFLRFVERANDMIKRSGENIAPAEVETVINQHHAVSESAVVGIPDIIRDERVKAFIVVKKNEELTEAEIIEFCKERLSDFRVPEDIVFVECLPRTTLGKIQRHKLLQR